MSTVTTAITDLNWHKVKIDFSEGVPKIYFGEREIKKIASVKITPREIIIEHALLEETYDILNNGYGGER